MAHAPAALAYVFADELLEPCRRRRAVVHVPGRQVAVDEVRLATHVLALTLFGLFQSGAVMLRLERARALGVLTRTAVLVTAPTPVTGGVVETALGAHLEPWRPVTAWQVVHDALGHDSDAPAREVVRWAARAAGDAGLLAPVGDDADVLVTDAVRTARPEWRVTHDAWCAFVRWEPLLATALLASCAKAVRARVGEPLPSR